MIPSRKFFFPAERRRIVVARNRLALCDYLRQQFFGDKEVEVLVDRRWRERRQGVQAQAPERRRADRRREPVSAEDLNRHGFVVIRRKPQAVNLLEIEEVIRSLYNQIEVGPPGNGNGSRKGKPDEAKRLVSDEPSVTREEWQTVLEKVGIDSLRLPENGALCATWRRFLNELRGGT